MNFRQFIEKLRNLPDNQKKIVLWTIVAVLGVAMAFFWIRSAAQRIDKLLDIHLPEIELPNTEVLNSLVPEELLNQEKIENKE